YLGCNVLRTSHLVQTAAAVFDRLGLDYVAVGGPTYCCGIQHHREGQVASGERYASHTVDLLARMAPREAVMWCRAARRLLQAVPAITLVDFEPDPRWGRTCTAALQTQLGREKWRQIVLDDIDRALGAGASHMAGVYHGCHRELCRFEAERPIVFEHYLTLFARALGIEFEDTYKKYAGWGDPDRILEDATPCMASNGVDPAI